MFARLGNSAAAVDLTQIKFDVTNAEHIAALKASISSFTSAVGAIQKTDIIIAVPVTASLLLWMAGCYGTMIELLLVAGCAATLWASNVVSQRAVQYQAYQEKLTELLAIYKKCVTDHGYQIFANENLLLLLKTIAPYVETRQLWSVSANNPVDYPEGFKHILSTAPHRIPFGEARIEAPASIVSFAAGLVGISTNVQTIAPVVIQQHANTTMGLFRNVTADSRLALYGYNEDQGVKLNKR